MKKDKEQRVRYVIMVEGATNHDTKAIGNDK
jgi:hypothetical protein